MSSFVKGSYSSKFLVRFMRKTKFKSKKSSLHYTRGITTKPATNGGAHLRGLALGQHSFEETSQRWRTVRDIVSDLSAPEAKLRLTAPIAIPLTTAPVVLKYASQKFRRREAFRSNCKVFSSPIKVSSRIYAY